MKSAAKLGLFTLFTLGALAGALPSRAAFTPPAEGTELAVATDNAEATRAALDAMNGGGNAFDGAIAAALTLGVASPAASGIGGGGFAVMWIAKEKKLVALDFREAAPAGVEVQELLDRKLRGAFIGVPGEPAGLAYIQSRWARRALADDASYAVTLAARGFPVSRHLADLVTRFAPRLPRELGELLPGGAPVAFRAMVQRPELGRTLARYALEGPKIFYEGDVGERIVSAARAQGGHLAMSDLASYRVHERPPLTRSIGARTIATMPAPSAGGLMLLETALLYGASERSELRAMGFGSSAYLHAMGEAMRGAIADRVRLVGDPYLDPNVDLAVSAALEPGQIAARKAKIAPDKTHPSTEFLTREEGTSHLVVSDAEGNVVSLTTTINNAFGAMIVAPGTGVLLNDELLDFSLPDELQGFGVVGLGPNKPRAGARPVSSMTPTIVLEDGKPILAAGGSGGRRIATGVTQAVMARLIFGLDPAACASAPRIYTNGKETFVDPEIPEDVRAGLRARGEAVSVEVFLTTGVQMIAWEKGRVLAASDPRKGGFAAAQ